MVSRNALTWACLSTAALLSFGCSDKNNPPVLDPLADRVGFVDHLFQLAMSASDEEGDTLQYSFTSDLVQLSERSTFTQNGRSALLRFTPQTEDLGIHALDVSVSDGAGSDTKTLALEIRYASSGNGPKFQEPSQTGAAFDLSKSKTLSLGIVIVDPDRADVVIKQEAPLIPGAELTRIDGQTASWTWTPSADQVAAQDRYTLTLSADDGLADKVFKHFQIVLVNPSVCAGAAPALEHQPADVASAEALELEATVSDDKGLKGTPMFLYSLSKPLDPPELAKLTAVQMVQKSGDTKQGLWGVSIPNPVTNQPKGAKATIYYVFLAQDADDLAAGCSHTTVLPADTSFQMTVTNPGN